MSAIRSSNTKPEIYVRQLLHAIGFRYRLHVKALPGTPDLVLPKYSAVIFVHGCFWHGHGCILAKIPSSNTAFWSAKIKKNKERDVAVVSQLKKLDWRIMTIRECALRGRYRQSEEGLQGYMTNWLCSDSKTKTIRSKRSS